MIFHGFTIVNLSTILLVITIVCSIILIISPDHHQVVHDCRNDSAALFFQCDVQVRNVFDTQVMIIIFNRSIMIIMIIFIGIMIMVNFIRNSRL